MFSKICLLVPSHLKKWNEVFLELSRQKFWKTVPMSWLSPLSGIFPNISTYCICLQPWHVSCKAKFWKTATIHISSLARESVVLTGTSSLYVGHTRSRQSVDYIRFKSEKYQVHRRRLIFMVLFVSPVEQVWKQFEASCCTRTPPQRNIELHLAW